MESIVHLDGASRERVTRPLRDGAVTVAYALALVVFSAQHLSPFLLTSMSSSWPDIGNRMGVEK